VPHLSWLEAIVIGALQGVAELFPVSSLGHSILLPAVIGGTWSAISTSPPPSRPTSPSSSGCMSPPRWRSWCSSGATGCASSGGS
jgi:hypothetical protein